MIKKLAALFLVLFFYFFFHRAFAVGTTSIAIFPSSIRQGEPMMITIEGANQLSSVKRITFGKTPLGVFLYQGKPTALAGVDLNKKPGVYKISALLARGQIIEKEITVNAREKIETPLGIPQKLGGNTLQSERSLVVTLRNENLTLLNLRTGKKSFWADKFLWPLAQIAVTDGYGYFRKTGAYSIAHKGTDFKADEGTPVMAVNRGVVRLAKNFRDYGKTIVIDHGLGLMSLYMHLSEIKVGAGELVTPGQMIGLSGQTGYADKPHLHFSIRINGIAIDPMKFFELFK